MFDMILVLLDLTYARPQLSADLIREEEWLWCYLFFDPSCTAVSFVAFVSSSLGKKELEKKRKGSYLTGTVVTCVVDAQMSALQRPQALCSTGKSISFIPLDEL